MQIGALANRAGLNPRTIRYYEQIGVLPVARRTRSGYREYTGADFERLEFIRNAKALGVTLEEITEVLAFRDRGVSPCPYVLELIDAKVNGIQDRIEGLRMLARDLKHLRRAAAGIPRSSIVGKARFCHIIENQKLLQRKQGPAGVRKR